MAEHRLISAYRDDLRRQLPAQLAAEVSDGLDDAQEKYIGRGMDPDQAALAAIHEFGSAGAVADAFRQACPVWRVARALIVTGPVVGGWWAAALIAGHAWDWPIPIAVLLMVGVILASSILLLVVSAKARRYQAVIRSGIAGCIGVVTLDVSVVSTAMLLAPGLRWQLVVAAGASAARLAFVTGSMRRAVFQRGV